MTDETVVKEEMNKQNETFADATAEVTHDKTAVDGEAVTNSEQAAESEPLSLEAQLAAAQAEAAKNLDGWMRAQAEFANARKRFTKQRADAYTNATADAVSKLLPILDDFERAFESVPETVASNSWFEGVQLVERKLRKLLEDFNVEALDAVGQPFDPTFHEALSQEESDEYESGHVTRELVKGYKLGDRVIRPSLVTVAV